MIKFNHKTIFLICFIGGIERFIFNGFRAILTLYMVKELLSSSSTSLELYGLIMMMSYFMPLLGGWLISKINIQYNSLIFGFISYVCGSLILIFIKDHFLIGVSFLLCGCGLIRPVIFPILGLKIKESGFNSESIFTYFYAFMNFSTLLGTLTCSIFGEGVSWKIAFIIMLGMSCIGILCSFYLKRTKTLKENSINVSLFILFSVTVIDIFFNLERNIQEFFIYYSIILTIILFIKFIFITDIKNHNLKIYFFMLFVHICFFTIYEQSGSALVLFVENHVNRNISFFGFNSVPATFFQALDPFFNILLGICFAYIWGKQKNYKIILSPLTKMILGLSILAAGFIVLIIASCYFKISFSPWILFLAAFLFVGGEIFTVPVGISLITDVTSNNRAAFYTGFWSFIIGIAQFFSGKIASVALGKTENLSKIESMIKYNEFFIILLLLSIGSIILCLFLKKFIK